MRRPPWIVLLTAGLMGLTGCGAERGEAARPELRLERVLGSAAAGFARALEPRAFVFPRDHGPHPEFRTEWWYLTGNLTSAAGRRFGYQLTFFRSALAAPGEAPTRASSWATTQVYMAHFALTDVAGGKLHAHQRFARGAVGLAGAQSGPFAVWLEDWSMRAESPGDLLPLRLHAGEAGAGIELHLAPGKPLVLQGERGLSRKSAEPGNASYYYSYPRLPTTGTVEVGGETFAVHGDSWFDREWSTSALAEDQVGWDWFALQLDDGSELMLYRMRRRDGSADPASRGTRIHPDGRSEALDFGDFEILPTGHWQSADGRARYPSTFTLSIPAEGLELQIAPVLPDQELRLAVRYWEGAVDVTGQRHGAPVRGRGYVELTGYAGTRPPR